MLQWNCLSKTWVSHHGSWFKVTIASVFRQFKVQLSLAKTLKQALIPFANSDQHFRQKFITHTHTDRDARSTYRSSTSNLWAFKTTWFIGRSKKGTSHSTHGKLYFLCATRYQEAYNQGLVYTPLAQNERKWWTISGVPEKKQIICTKIASPQLPQTSCAHVELCSPIDPHTAASTRYICLAPTSWRNLNVCNANTNSWSLLIESTVLWNSMDGISVASLITSPIFAKMGSQPAVQISYCVAKVKIQDVWILVLFNNDISI